MCKLSYQKRKKKDINNELKKKKFLDNIAQVMEEHVLREKRVFFP
jgi:hypothetical protein